MVSLIMSSFKRALLLDFGLWSIANQSINYDLEIIICNDGIHDNTESICKKYSKNLNIKYIFTGQRNINGLKSRIPGFALNIGVKQSQGEIIILSCPEIFHLNNSINLLITPLLNNNKLLSIPREIYFDDNGNTLNYLIKNKTINLPKNLLDEINKNPECKQAVQMPFFLGLYKEEFIKIGGYDEDFIGYAGDDNDLMNRLKKSGLTYHKTDSKIIHLYHGQRCDSQTHWDNLEWVYNYKLFLERKNILIRNKDRKWGEL